ncbi:MAG: DNA-directed RNA polymerase subunit beta' [Thermoguttaceae bacterium]|nr:DNA-directed RNA polymerase subunit beta' [Thermoguttaceae bacterium]
MSTIDQKYTKVNDYTSVKISLARPHDIRSWSHGEVKKPETINYRTYRSEKDGLFCERIFGPEKDWECTCGKYRGLKFKGMICDRCGVKIAHSRERRKRMGHIELAAPVVHIWFFKAMPSRLGCLLEMKTTALEKVIYYQDYVVTDAGDTPLKVTQLLTDEEYREAVETYGAGSFKAEMGAEAIRTLLSKLDMTELSKQLRDELATTKSAQRKKELINRLKLVESLRDSDNDPAWMVLDVIPVIPPDLRPLVPLESGNFATSDLNDLYRRIINRNNRLRKLEDLNAPEVIIKNEKRMLQQSVDALFDNGRCKRPVMGPSNRPLKSLTDMIKGKQGRFRENLLGKRVDYSARSVIVVGPYLKLHQCGLPKKIALELFQPFIIRRLKDLRHADTIKSAKKMLERKDEEVWDILEEVIRNHPVLLNRAPTLHRMGIQAFEPILVEGNAIKLHPLVCKGFNADFDGDQMAVHLPLSIEAQVEAYTLMMSTNNIFSPASGKPIIAPSQDVVMGNYYLTLEMENRLGEGMVFSSFEEAFMAYDLKKVDIHAKVEVRLPEGLKVAKEKGKDSNEQDDNQEDYKNRRIVTTVGRMIFNEILPKGMPYYNILMTSKALQKVISDCYELLGRAATIDLLDSMNPLGFRESTRSGLSFSVDDLITPASKKTIIEETEKEVAKAQMAFIRGAQTSSERHNKVTDLWTQANKRITNDMLDALKNDKHYEGEANIHNRPDGYVNPIFLMSESGARGGREQIRQLAGMRGLMSKPNGQIIETPIKANFREGLSVLEYFSSTHGARKGLADTALKTASSGYLTRKLADVAQNVVITCHDCGTNRGITKSVINKGDESTEVKLSERIRGRVSRTNIVDPFTDEVIVRENEPITAEIARRIEKLGLEKIMVRSPMTCEAPLGVCALCYGMDLSTSALVEQGMAVGIIAAQSIGEPGTQLTMRTFHIGGTAAKTVAENSIKTTKEGTVKLVKMKVVVNNSGKQIVLDRNGSVEILDKLGRTLEYYKVQAGAEMKVSDGQHVKANDTLCEWDPHNDPIFTAVPGRVRFDDFIEGETFRREEVKDNSDVSGKMVKKERIVILEHRGAHHPQIIIEGSNGETLDMYPMPDKSYLEVNDGDEVLAGTILAKTPKKMSATEDITGGLTRVTEIFEARVPKEPAVIADIDGIIELKGKGKNKRGGKREVVIASEKLEGETSTHLIPHGKNLRVRTGDRVSAGDALVDGPQNPHEILRIKNEEAVQQYLVNEVQKVYRSQGVTINDKHIEVIVSQMLRKVLITSGGDTKLLEGALIDKFDFKAANEKLKNSVKVKDPGASSFQIGELVPKDKFERENEALETEGKQIATWETPTPAQAKTQLLGITKAAVQSHSFLSSASFQETTKVLTEAALAGKVDNLIGLKENVILGHMIPAGTGFKLYQNAEFGISKEAIEEMRRRPQPVIEENYTLMNDVPEQTVDSDELGSKLDSLFGNAPKADDDLDNQEEFVNDFDPNTMFEDDSDKGE